jgi:hypothetical protein
MARDALTTAGRRTGSRGDDEHMAEGNGGPDGAASGQGCTQAQLRRFIKSRAYVPMHELRRRFDINGEADDVLPVDTRDGRFWVGLPPRESGFLAELVDRGEVGLELCHDPCVDMVVGVYAMRPVGR